MSRRRSVRRPCSHPSVCVPPLKLICQDLQDEVPLSISHHGLGTTIVRQDTFDKLPETLAVIELLEMAELMDDKIVRTLGWEQDNLVVEVEIARTRAASPSRFLIFYRDLLERERERGMQVV